jgi:hypothetical protein
MKKLFKVYSNFITSRPVVIANGLTFIAAGIGTDANLLMSGDAGILSAFAALGSIAFGMHVTAKGIASRPNAKRKPNDISPR